MQQRELGPVRELARQLADGSALGRILDTRQQDIARRLELSHQPARKAMLMRQQRQRLLSRVGGLAALASAVFAALFHHRGSSGFARDSGPTSIA